MKDRFALLRKKDPLTLIEAAHIVAEVPPGTTWPNKGLSAEQQEARAAFNHVRDRLIADATSGLLSAELVYESWPAQRGENPFTREPTYQEARKEFKPERSTVCRANLVKWCTDQGMQPATFAAPDRPLGSLERKYLLQLVGTLCELAGIDLRPDNKGHTAAQRLRVPLEMRGATIKQETVAKRIKEARSEIDPIGPGKLPDMPS